ncbi:MAG: hypothetical protein AB1489_09410 [Acidobacteriota bacterium]
MKILKVILLMLLGIVVLLVGMMLLGMAIGAVSLLIKVLFWLAVFFIIGTLVWKFLIGSDRKTVHKTPQLKSERNLEELAEANRKLAEIKLEEIKRQQGIKQ